MRKIQLTPSSKTYKDAGYLAMVYLRDVATGRMLKSPPHSKPQVFPTARAAMAHATDCAMCAAWNQNAKLETIGDDTVRFIVKLPAATVADLATILQEVTR